MLDLSPQLQTFTVCHEKEPFALLSCKLSAVSSAMQSLWHHLQVKSAFH